MPAYAIALIDVHDRETMSRYVQEAPATFAPYGGRASFVGPIVEELESELGEHKPGTTAVVIEFDTPEDARRWHDSEEYAPVMPLRHQAARSSLFIVGERPQAA